MLTYRALSLVLASPVYIARAPQGADDVLSRPLGRWAPLVDDATWQRVRDYVDSHHKVPHQASRRFLLTGMLRCPQCGARMHGSSRPGHGARYRCASTTLGANAAVRDCRTSALSNQVDVAVLAEVFPLIETESG